MDDSWKTVGFQNFAVWPLFKVATYSDGCITGLPCTVYNTTRGMSDARSKWKHVLFRCCLVEMLVDELLKWQIPEKAEFRIFSLPKHFLLKPCGYFLFFSCPFILGQGGGLPNFLWLKNSPICPIRQFFHSSKCIGGWVDELENGQTTWGIFAVFNR